MEIRHVVVPPGALFRCVLGPRELNQDRAGGCVGDAEVAIDKKIPQPFALEFSIARPDVRKLRDGAIQHGALFLSGDLRYPRMRISTDRASPEEGTGDVETGDEKQ